MKNAKKLVSVVAVIVVVVLVLSMFSGGGSAKKVATDFAEALLADVDAKKAVSLMSNELLEQTLSNTGCATKKVLIEYLEPHLEGERSGYKSVKIKYVDQQEIYDGYVEVYLSCTYIGSSLFSDEVTETITITLTKEGAKWRVDNF